MLQHYRPIQKYAHGHGRETRKVFSLLVVISLVGTISGKSLKLLPPDVINYFKAKMHQIRYSAPQTL